MEKIIKAAVERGASDLHIKAGDVFRARIDGKLVALTKQALTPDQTKSIALKLIPNEDDRNRIDDRSPVARLRADHAIYRLQPPPCAVAAVEPVCVGEARLGQPALAVLGLAESRGTQPWPPCAATDSGCHLFQVASRDS